MQDKWLSPIKDLQSIRTIVQATSPETIVNHMPLYTSKEISFINNYDVEFTDGSWCNVSTGDIINRGPGYIYIGFPYAIGKERITEGPRIYDAERISISNADIDLNVEVGITNNIQISLIGIYEDIQNIRIFVRNGTCFIEDIKKNEVLLDDIAIITGNRQTDLKIHVVIPQGTPLTTTNILGSTYINDVEGPLNLTATAGDIFVEHTTSAVLAVEGPANVYVKELDGTNMLRVTGSGSIRVAGGNMTLLQGAVIGSGQILFNGTAQDAELVLLGTGAIRIRQVQNKPRIDHKGSGTIVIENWENRP